MQSGVERRVRLAPAPESARTARRLVAEVLASANARHFEDIATLLTSELVTNGIVHAHTELEILVDATSTWVRVEVVDGNPQLPRRRDYDAVATTGRGMEMVELLADDFGVEALEDEGKRCWFRLGAVPGTPEPARRAAATDSSGHGADETIQVRLTALPVTLYCAWQQHAEALLREATLAALEDTGDTGAEHDDYPLANRALGTLAAAAGEAFALRDAEVALTDLDIELPADVVPWFPILRDLLGRAAALAAAGELLTPASLPEIAAVRHWVCDEIARQSAGLPPTPWVEQEIDVPTPDGASQSVLQAIRDTPAAVVAADSANRIVAVSEQAAELLGWDANDLEGRRLITIIPARLREQHVAGFTRHLLDGRVRILGEAVRVPALRKDGSEIDVDMLVERRADGGIHGLFVATFIPR